MYMEFFNKIILSSLYMYKTNVDVYTRVGFPRVNIRNAHFCNLNILIALVECPKKNTVQ